MDQFGKKLTLDQVNQIRKDERTQKEIAKDFGIGRATIYRIKKFKTWRNI